MFLKFAKINLKMTNLRFCLFLKTILTLMKLFLFLFIIIFTPVQDVLGIIPCIPSCGLSLSSSFFPSRQIPCSLFFFIIPKNHITVWR